MDGFMNDLEMDIISIDESENDIPCRRSEKFDFPAVGVFDTVLYFNSKCSVVLRKSKIFVSKTNDFVIFREAPASSTNAFLKLPNKNGAGFRISSRRIKAVTGLKDGQYFKLYTVKGGGYAIKRHEPIQMPD